MKPGTYDVKFHATREAERVWTIWCNVNAQSVEVLEMEALTTGTATPEMRYRVRVSAEVAGLPGASWTVASVAGAP
jgi:hypothetical protein